MLRLFPALLLLAACTDPVADIDRTQGNLIRKADLAGEWYMMETITGVPPTSWFTFIGETSKLERVKFVIQENLLVAYRSYPQVPGADSPSAGLPFDGTDNPVAAWPIVSHLDVQRSYDPSTGEQTNIIEENTYDRLWHERDFIRVNWAQNQVANFDFIAPTTAETSLGYFIPEELGGPDAFYSEEADNTLQYFDVLGRLFVEPSEDGCLYTWYGWGAEDCTSAEITVRSSFARVPASTYEPFHYDDRLMSRFGYFRSERYTYDEQRGVRETGRQYLIQRHNIWKASHTAEGTPIPIPDREVRTVPYYLSENFPQDDLLLQAARDAIAQWNVAAQTGVRTAQGKDDVPDVFVLCQNPVQTGDPEACGAPGFSPRIGDLRYSTLHWVDPETLEGLLGYGPSASDPLTGETIAGKAYVYGAAVNTYASYAVDIIRYFNDDLEFDALVTGTYFSDEIKQRLAGETPVTRPDPSLERVPVERSMQRRGRPERPNRRTRDLRPFDPSAVERRLEKARDAGLNSRLLSTEMKRALEHSAGRPFDELSPEQQDPTRHASPEAMKRRGRMRAAARARGVDFADMIAPDVQGMVRKYAGRTDYDQMWRELRAEVFASTAEHEVGHTLGLRHNFQGSYDSLNYFDKYWELREETLGDAPAGNLAEIYQGVNLTEAQHEGHMRQQQYSSIMDYGYSWQNDIMGLGKYDQAALIFGYTAGSYRVAGPQCERYDSVADGTGCIAKVPGYVEVFKKRKDDLGQAGELLDRGELGFTFDDAGLPSVNILERFHYTTLALAFPSLDDLKADGREYIRYADYLDGKSEPNRRIKVPYSFCSDEWESGLISCHVFDQGADPFEVTLSRIHDYRAYYPFVNFKRDRIGFFEWDPLDSYFWRVFLPLSDYFQSWYLAPYGDDPLFDRTYDLAIHSGFSLIGEALATPPYGSFCANPDDQLVWRSTEPNVQGQVYETDCIDQDDTYEIEPGVGRRPFSRYDAEVGYYFSDKPQEAGHYWTTLAAAWAMFDPDAYVVGSEGDTGFYSISFYDWFDNELERLVGDLLSENYARFAPRARIMDGDERRLELTYAPAAPLYDGDTEAYYNAETGERLPDEGIEGMAVQTEPTFSLATDMLFYGFLYTTFAYSTRFNDSLNIFRPGNDATVEIDTRVSERIAFTDPTSGIQYAAVQPRCDGPTGGHRGLCGSCEDNSECAGFTGFIGGVFCQPVDDAEEDFRCLQDCTDDPDLCPEGQTCNAAGNCVPEGGGFCQGQGACGPDTPLGVCPEGTTCFEGACVEPVVVSEHCQFIQPEDTPAAQLIKKGQLLAQAYNTSLRDWYTHPVETPEDQAEDDRLATIYFRNRYRLNILVDLMETTIATYQIFGRIY